MGWTYYQTTRKRLEADLTKGWRRGNSEVRILRKKWGGWTRLWLLVERVDVGPDETGEIVSNVSRFIIVALVRSIPTRGEWGYKDVSEECGPNEVDAPLSWFKELTAPINDYSREWREKVRAYHASIGTGVTFSVGDPVSLSNGWKGTLVGKKPLVVSVNGVRYRVKRTQLRVAS